MTRCGHPPSLTQDELTDDGASLTAWKPGKSQEAPAAGGVLTAQPVLALKDEAPHRIQQPPAAQRTAPITAARPVV